MYQKPPISLLMRTRPRVAWAGPRGVSSTLPLQVQSPAKNASLASSGEGAGGAGGAWETAGRAASAPRNIAMPTRHQPVEAILFISSPPVETRPERAAVSFYGRMALRG